MPGIQFDITGNFNINGLETAKDQIEQARAEIGLLQTELKKSMDGLESPAVLLNEQLKRCLITADQFTYKADQASKALGQGTMSDEEKSSVSQQLQNIFDDFNAMKSVLTGSGDLSVEIAKNMLNGLPSALKQEFNTIAPMLTAELRSGMSSLNRSADKIMSTDSSSMVVEAMKIPAVAKLLNQTSATADQKAGFIKSLLANAASVQSFQEYQMQRWGRPTKVSKGPSSVEELLPSAYKGRYSNYDSAYSKDVFGQGFDVNKLYSNDRIKKRNARSILDVKSTGNLVDLIKDNAVAARAAESIGLMTRDKEGVLTLDHNVTQKELLSLREALWKEFQTRTTGLTEKLDDFYGLRHTGSAKQSLEDIIIKRAQSGTGGLTLAAMQGLSDILEYGSYTKAAPKSGVQPGVHRVIRPEDEAKRMKELYTVDKISPFAKGEGAAIKKVSLAESQMTRMLGMQGKNYQDMDSVKIISFAGYDPENAEHVAQARKLKEEGYTDQSGHYSVHAIHGTGSDTVFRMIRDKEAEQLKAKYVPFAKALGLKGTNVLNAFVPEYDEKGNPFEFGSPEALGKHMEQLNKMWTDSYVWGSDLSNKKFALVDFSKDKSKHSDGLGYLGKGIGPGNFQTRFGLSGKGSFYEIGTETVGEWAKDAGLTDKQGRYMVHGPDGTMFDASGYNGLIDVSTVKNLLAYQGLSNEEANNALTAMIREFPIGVVSDYSYDGDAKGLGSQMMTFLAMSPKIQMHQAQRMAQHRLELETNEGKRKYIFNNPLTDIVAKKANDPKTGDEFLASDPQAKQHYDRYLESLDSRMQAGEFINFDDIADIQNERLLRSPLLADILTRGGLTDTLVAQYQKEFQEAHGREFSKDEVRDILTLKNGVADFGHMDADMVAGLRSPTGFNQMVVRKNYAKLLAPIYKRHGMQAFGFHANNEDMEQLAGADMDADMVKSIASKVNSEDIDIVSELADLQKIANEYGITAKEAEIITNALPTLQGGNNMQNTENWLRTLSLSILAPQKMGSAADAGSRLAGNLDLFDVTMRNAAVTAAKANNAYDPATTLPKKPKEIEKDAALIQANMLGQEYQKIPHNLKDIYNVMETQDEDGNVIYTTKDGKTLIAKEDVFQTSSGRLMNKSLIQGEDKTRLDKTNLPSVQSSAAVGAMLGAKNNYDRGYTSAQLMDDLLEVMGVTTSDKTKGEAIGYNGAGQATQRLMKNKRAMLAQFYGGTRFSITDEERDILASQYAESLDEIKKRAYEEESESGKLGYVKDENGKFISTDQRIGQLKRKYGLSQVEMMLGTYKGLNGVDVITGMTYDNIKEKYGERIANALGNAGIVQLPDKTRGRVTNEADAAYRTLGDKNPHFAKGTQQATVKPEQTQPVVEQTKPIAEENRTVAKPSASTVLSKTEKEKLKEIQRIQAEIKEDEEAIANGDLLVDAGRTRQGEQKTISRKRRLAVNKKELDELQTEYDRLHNEQQPSGPNGPTGPVGPGGPPGGGPPNDNPPWFYNHDRFMEDMANKDRTGIDRILRGQSALSAWENIIQDAERETSTLFGEVNKGKDLTSSAKWYASRNRKYDYLSQAKEEAMALFRSGDAFGAENAIVQQANQKLSTYGYAFNLGRAAHIENTIKDVSDRMDRSINGKPTQGENQLKQIEKWNEDIKTLEDERAGYLASLDRMVDTDEEGKDLSKDRIKDLDIAIEQAREKQNKGFKQLVDANVEQLQDIGAEFDTLISGKQKSPATKIAKAVKTTQKRANEVVALMEDLHEKGLISDSDYMQQRAAWDTRLGQIQDGTYRNQIEKEEAAKLGFRGAKVKRSQMQQEFAQQLLDEALADYNGPHASLDEYRVAGERVRKYQAWLDESKYTAQSEKHQDNLDKMQTEQMLETRQATKQERIDAAVDRAVIARNNYIARQDETFDADAYRKKYSEEYLRDQIEKQINKEDERNKLTQQNRIEDIKRQNDLSAMRQDFSYKQQNRQIWGGSHSRFVNAYRSQEGMRNNLQATIKDAESRKLQTQSTINQLTKERRGTKKGTDDYRRLSNDIALAKEQMKGFDTTIDSATAQMDKFSKPAMMVRSGLSAINDTVGMFVKRFGRQMFQKAISEATQFVKQFDKTMTEIQMITLKSDDQMSTLGNGLINQAKELKMSITDISQSAATLYRQGLTDEEVSERLDVVSKFSKVSGANVADATKLITVAMNTGLVSNAMEASDIVTALGDSAATNAQQIEKGIEKAGAAAAADGTTFGELAAMLTAITSTTQIGGNVAGRTLNTIMGRMNKIGTNELIIDENGNKISGSAVSQLLKAQGVNTYDEAGNKRSTFDVLYDLSKKWDNISDAEQQQLATAIAGTRQYSNFAAIMQGMNEGKIDEYMDLIGESSGITNKKHEVYTKSLEASLTDLRNTFDSVINDLVDKGVITQITQGIADIVTGIGSIISSAGGLPAVIGLFTSLAIAMSAIRGGAVGAAATAGILAVAGISYAVGNSLNSNSEYHKSASEINSDYVKKAVSKTNEQQTAINRYQELYTKKTALTDDEKKEFQSLTVGIGSYAGASTDSIKSLTTAIGSLGDAATDAAPEVKKAAANIKNEAEERLEKDKRNRFVASIGAGKGANKIADEVDSAMTEFRNESYGSSTKFEDETAEYLKARGSKADRSESGIRTALLSSSEFLQPLMNLMPYGTNESGMFKSDEKQYALKYVDEATKYFEELSNSAFISPEWFVDYEGNSIDADKWKDKDAKYWKDVLQKASYAQWKPTDENVQLINGIIDAYKAYSEQQSYLAGSPNDAQKTSLKTGIENFLTSNKELLPFAEDLIPYIAQSLTDQYYETAEKNESGLYKRISATKVEELLLKGLGYDNPEASNDEIKAKALELANKSNYALSKAEKLEMAGLSGDADFFVDKSKKPGEQGYIIDTEEAQKQMEDYKKNKYKEIKKYAVQDKNGNIVTENGKKLIYDTKEEYDTKIKEINDSRQTVQDEIDNRQAEIDKLEDELSYSTYWVERGNGNFSMGTRHDITMTGANAKEKAWDKMREEQEEFKKQNPYELVYNHDYVDEKGVLHKQGRFIGYTDSKGKSDRTAAYNIPEYDYYTEDENGNRTQSFYSYGDVRKYVKDQLASGRHVYARSLGGKTEYFEAGENFLQEQEELNKIAEKYAQEQYIAYGATYNPTRYKREGDQLYMIDDQLGRINLTDEKGRITQAGYTEARMALENDPTLKKQLMNEYTPQYNYREVDYDKAEGWAVEDALGIKSKKVYDVKPFTHFWDAGTSLSVEEMAEYDSSVEKIEGLKSSLTDYISNVATSVFEYTDSIVKVAYETVDKVLNPDNVAPNLEGHKRRFLGKAESGYQAWKSDDKNTYALTADEMLKYIWDVQNNPEYDKYNQYISPDSKYKDIQKLLYATDIGDNETWDLLYSSSEFGRLMDQIKTDDYGNVISAPDDILEQITKFLASKGRDYGSVELTSREKAQRASEAFKGITSEGWYLSQEAYNNALNAEYAKDIESPWQIRHEEYNRQLEQAEAIGDNELMNEIIARHNAEQKGLITKDEYALQRFAGARYLEDADTDYLNNIIGKRLTQKAKGANGGLTEREKAYAAELINNAQYGITGLTTEQKLSRINEIQQATSLSAFSEEELTEALSGYNNATNYIALRRKKDSKEGLTKKEQQDLQFYENELKIFKENTEFKFELEGIQQLEEAGKIASGVSSEIEKLRKGGKISLEVTMKYTTEGYEAGQQAAKLYNGTEAQQDEAAMAILDMSRDQYYADRDNNLEYAKSIEQSERQYWADTWQTRLNNTKNEADYQRTLNAAQAAGYDFVEGQYELPDGFRVGTNGVVYDKNGNADYAETQKRKAATQLRIGYVGTPGLDNINPLIGSKLSYTDIEKNDMLNRILSGKVKRTNENADLYDAAIESAGINTRNYLTMLENGKTPSAKLERAAMAETRQATEDLQEQEKLNQAKLSATTAGTMLSYQNLKYETDNKSGLAANRIIESFNGVKPEGIKSIEDLSKVVNSSNVKDWKTLLENNTELARKMSDAGITFDENGVDLSNLKGGAEGAAAALQTLITAVTGASEAYNKEKEVLSTEETYNRAMDYVSGKLIDEELGYEAYSQMIGNSQLAQLVRNNRIEYDKDNEEYYEYQNMSWGEKKDYLLEHGERAPKKKTFDPYEGLTPYERGYAETLETNAMFGISGLTDIDRYNGLQDILSYVKNGTLGSYRKQDRIGAFEDYTAGIEGASTWLSASEALESQGLKMSDLAGLKEGTDEYNAAWEAIQNIYGSMELAIEANEDFEDSIDSSGKALRDGSDYLNEYNIGLKVNNTNTKQSLEAIKQRNQLFAQAKNNQWYRDQFNKGKLGGGVSEKIFEMTGFDKTAQKDKKNKEKIKQLLEANKAEDLAAINSELEGEQQDYQDELNAYLSEHPIDIEADGLTVNVSTGRITVNSADDLASFVGEDIAAQMQAYVDELDGQGFDSEIELWKDNEGAWHGRVFAKDLKGGKPSGGGGGGKSAAQTTIDRQKHYQEQLKHRLNMLQIEETHMQSIGDESGLKKNWKQQAKQQEKLRKTYLEHAEELRVQMNSTKQGSDEWYQLRDQMNALLEAAASVTQALRDLKVKATELIISNKQRKEGKASHRSTMLSKNAEYWNLQLQAGNVKGFEDWVLLQNQQKSSYEQEIRAKMDSRKAYLKQMAEYGTKDEEWKKLQDLVYQVDEEIAGLENQKIQTEVEKDRAIVSQLQTDFSNKNATAEHGANVATTLSQLYQNNKDYGNYANTLRDQKGYYVDQYKNYQAAIAKTEKLLNSGELVKYSDAWYEARAALFSYQEALLQTANYVDEVDRAMQQAKITEITEKYNASKSDKEHATSMYSTAAERAKLLDQDNSYVILLQKQLSSMTVDRSSRKTYLDQLKDLLNQTKDPQAWEELTTRIKEVETDISQLDLSIDQLQQTINKANFENLKEVFEESDSRIQHDIKQVQQAESYYQTRGELTNYGSAMGEEKSLLERRAASINNYISQLKGQADAVKKTDPETYEAITQEIMRQEEAYSQLGTQIEQVTKKIKENEEKIRQARQAIENYIDKEIKNRIQKEKNMLNAEVNMQNQLLEVIKNRYREEWNIIKQDIDKKKQALEEEKNLINERLQAKKNAQSQSDKEEELAEYQRQLAVISADSTRTKDVKELQRKIEDLQKELAWNIADQEAAAAVETIDDQIKTYTDYVAEQEENLNRKLQDNNNLINEEDFVRAFGSKTSDNYIEIMKANNKNYQYATPEAQQQMINSWEETWKTMKGIVDTYWDSDEMKSALSGRQSFLEYLMKWDDEYKNASASGQESLLAKWGEAYDNYSASTLDNYTSVADSGSHEIVSAIEKLKDYTYKVEFSSLGTSDLNTLNQTLSLNYYVDQLKQAIKDLETDWRNESGAVDSGAVAATGNVDDWMSTVEGTHANKWVATWKAQKAYGKTIIEGGSIESTKSQEDAETQAIKKIESLRKAYINNNKNETNAIDLAQMAADDAKGSIKVEAKYMKGGLVDFTGPAWVDGSKTHPEAFLSAYDTETIRAMTDAMNYIRVNPGIVPDTERYSSMNNTVGDITITINEAQLKSDADFDEVARLVGQKFTRELSKQGFNLTGYGF